MQIVTKKSYYQLQRLTRKECFIIKVYERTGMLGEKDTSCRREMMTSVKPKDTGIFQPTSAFDMISCLHTTDHI